MKTDFWQDEAFHSFLLLFDGAADQQVPIKEHHFVISHLPSPRIEL